MAECNELLEENSSSTILYQKEKDCAKNNPLNRLERETELQMLNRFAGSLAARTSGVEVDPISDRER